MGVVYLDPEEPGYLAAIRAARSSCWHLISAFRDRGRNDGLFLIKARLCLEKDEPMLTWLLLRDIVPAGYIGEMFEPEFDSSRYPLGANVHVKAEALIDWAIVDAKVMQGGYTVRFVFDRASPESRAKILEGFQVTAFAPLPPDWTVA